jgi:Zn-dependent oligopeptidase
MQEKWVYDKKTFDSFAKHWETGKPVPPELFARIKASRTYRKGNYFTYQLMLASTDLRLHSTFDPTGNMTAAQVQQEQYKAMMVSPGGEGSQTVGWGWQLNVAVHPGLCFGLLLLIICMSCFV